MVHARDGRQQRTDRAQRLLKYAGLAGTAVALLLAVAVTALTVGPALLPSGAALGTVLFALLLAVVVVAVRRLHRERGRQVDPDPDWH